VFLHIALRKVWPDDEIVNAETTPIPAITAARINPTTIITPVVLLYLNCNNYTTRMMTVKGI
jgi:hypothetical protein